MAASGVRVRHFILGLLNEQSMSGYDIKRFLKGLSWLIGSPSYGSIYPALRGLLQDGLLSVEVSSGSDRPPRKIYSITDRGKQELSEWINQPAASSTSLKAFVMRLFLAGSLPHVNLVSQLRQRRTQVAEYRCVLQETAGTFVEEINFEQGLALDYGLAIAAAEIAWLDRALARISQETQSEQMIP